MARKPVIAGNWKMHKLIRQAVDTVLELKPLVANVNACEIIVAPPFTALKPVADRLEGSNIRLAAQDVCEAADFGARTGEINVAMLRDVGCSHVIIGHSERRQFDRETDQRVNQKIKAALSAQLIPLVCVGEMLAERQAGREHSVVGGQLGEGFDGLTADDLSRMIVAYEPVWAIGTGKTATPEIAQAMHAFIRRFVQQRYSAPTAEAVRVLYGGSVKPGNIKALMNGPDIDGALVGGASLEARDFAQIARYGD